MPIKTAVILAAGEGRRIWPFNVVRNKCAIPVANLPLIRRTAEDLHRAGVNKMIVVTGAEDGSIRAALRDSAIPVQFIEQPHRTGAADALRLAIPTFDDDSFLVLHGDLCLGPKTVQMLIHCKLDGASAAVLVDAAPADEESGSWIGVKTEGGRLAEITGHDRDLTQRLTGAFILTRSIFPYLDAHPGLLKSVPVGGMPPMEANLDEPLVELLEEGHTIAIIEPTDFAIDLDKPWHIVQANRAVQWSLTSSLSENRLAKDARISPSAEIEGYVELGEGSEIGSRVVVRGNAIVGAHTRIINGAILDGSIMVGDHTRVSDYSLVTGGTVVGSQCIVGHGAEMDGVMFDRSYLYHYCEICGVVGCSVDIGAATVCGTLRFDDDNQTHRIAGRREKGGAGCNGTFYGDYSRTGVNVITMPGTKIGVYSCVGGGIVVYEDVADRSLLLLKQETMVKTWGPERYGW